MLSPLVKKIFSTEDLALHDVFTANRKVYTFLNPVSYLSALDNKDLFERFDGIFADGSILVAAIKLVYGKSVTRRSFDMTSLAPELCRMQKRITSLFTLLLRDRNRWKRLLAFSMNVILN